MGQWSNRLDTYHTGCFLGGPRLLGSQLDFEGFQSSYATNLAFQAVQ